MARLIDADALAEEITKVKRCINSGNSDYLTGYISALSGVEGLIAYQPSVDAQPVVHGRWVYHMAFDDESKRDDFDVVCSHCGDFLVSCYDAEEAEIFRRDYGWCSKCGAKMDLEGAADGY